jgi:hypothetical protein
MTESEAPAPNAAAFFSQPVYDRLKFVAQIILPALGTLVFAIGGIWGWRFTTQTVGTITALDLFLGAILQFSSAQYYKSGANFDGTIHIEDTPEKTTHTLALNTPVEDLTGKSSVTFNVAKVNKHEAPE